MSVTPFEPSRRNRLANKLRVMLRPLNSALTGRSKGGDGQDWHSWDPTPWNYPWLTTENLKAEKAFSEEFLASRMRYIETATLPDLSFAYYGNMANVGFHRAQTTDRTGFPTDIVRNPMDTFVMSHPAWEFSEAVWEKDELYNVQADDSRLQSFENFHQFPMEPDWKDPRFKKYLAHLTRAEIEIDRAGVAALKTISKLRDYSALWATQVPFTTVRLTKVPYIASQSGGDLWLEASRSDVFGQQQRSGYGNAHFIAVSNAWSYAHVRRFGFKRAVYLPKVIDETIYKPEDAGGMRRDWERRSGGQKFILTTSRLDRKNKGSDLVLNAFRELASLYPDLRLVLTVWGNDMEDLLEFLEGEGLRDRVILEPVSGKARLRRFLNACDIFLDQFKLGYFGSAGLEALACGAAVIGRIETAHYEALSETGAPPIRNASNVSEIVEQSRRLLENPDDLANLKKGSRKWFLENHSVACWSDRYTAAMIGAAEGLEFPEGRTGLSAPLTRIEKDYLNWGLAHAPIHPNYGW